MGRAGKNRKSRKRGFELAAELTELEEVEFRLRETFPQASVTPKRYSQALLGISSQCSPVRSAACIGSELNDYGLVSTLCEVLCIALRCRPAPAP